LQTPKCKQSNQIATWTLHMFALLFRFLNRDLTQSFPFGPQNSNIYIVHCIELKIGKQLTMHLSQMECPLNKRVQTVNTREMTIKCSSIRKQVHRLCTSLTSAHRKTENSSPFGPRMQNLLSILIKCWFSYKNVMYEYLFSLHPEDNSIFYWFSSEKSRLGLFNNDL
jgi:hypothetical protein